MVEAIAKIRTKAGSKVIQAGMGYTIGNFLLKGIAFLCTPIFVRLMNPDDFGVYNVFLSYDAIVYLFVGLALHTSIKNAKYKFQEEFHQYISTIIALILINTVVVLGILLLLFPLVEQLTGYSVGLILVLVILGFSDSMLYLYNNYLALEYKYKNYLQIAFIVSISGIILSLLLILWVYPTQRYLGRILGHSIPIIGVAAILVWKIFRRTKPKLEWRFIKYGLSYSIPIIPHGLSQIVLAQFDRIMILNYIDATKAGLYSFAYTIATIYNVIVNSVETVWSPWFYERMSRKEYEKIKEKMGYMLYFMSFLAISIIMFSPEIITILGSEKYYETKYCVIPVLLGMYFSSIYILPAQVEYYHKKTGYIALGTACTAIVNIGLNVLCIPNYGYIAAAYTTLVSYILYLIFHYIIALKLLQNVKIFCHKQFLGSTVLVCIVSIGTIYYIERFFIRVVLYLLVSMLAFYIFQRERVKVKD